MNIWRKRGREKGGGREGGREKGEREGGREGGREEREEVRERGGAREQELDGKASKEPQTAYQDNCIIGLHPYTAVLLHCCIYLYESCLNCNV